MCNGVLAGLVGVTSGVATIEPWAAIIAGSTGALVYAASDWLVGVGLNSNLGLG